MKKCLIMFGLGAAAIVGLSSCQSTNANGGYSETDFEEAMPMSDLTGNGDLPPWVFEGDDNAQIAAGETTDRNHFPVPDDGLTDSAPAAEKKKGGWFSQNQEELATNTEDVIVEDDPNVFVPETTPVATPTPQPTHTAVVKPAPKPATPVAVNTAKKPSAGKKQNTGKKQKVAHYDKPTMVVYQVKKGDNLTLIAKRSNTTIEAIRKASGIKGDKIVAGQTIKVPYTPNSYKMSQQGKNAKNAKNDKGAKGGKTAGSTYTVKQGDTISAIAARNGVSTKELLAANGLSAQDASKIRPGRHLTVPGKAAAPSKKSTANSSSKKATTKPAAKKTTKKGKR